MEKYYTIKEVAEIFKVSKRTIYDLIHSNKLRNIKIGRIYRISSEDLNRYLNTLITF